MRLVKGKMLMETNSKIINIELKKGQTNNEILETEINNETFILDFTSTDQTNLRKFFAVCLEELSKNQFIFHLIDNNIVEDSIIKKTATEYITELNQELQNCYKKITEKE